MAIPKSVSSSSVSSASSVSSLDASVKSGAADVIKFLCSYGGRILPRYSDGKLRYVGGDTRVLSVDRSIPFSEFLARMGELCGRGSRVVVRCQLPTEDLDALVTLRSDEDLANVIEEYGHANRERASAVKIRAFLLPVPPPQPSSKPSSPPLSAAGSPPKGKSPVYPPIPGSAGCSSVHRQGPGFPSRIAAGGVLPCQYQRHHEHRTVHHHRHHHVGPACIGYGGGGISSSSAVSHRHPQQAYLVHSGHRWQ